MMATFHNAKSVLDYLETEHTKMDWYKALPSVRQYIGLAAGLNYRFVLSNLVDNGSAAPRLEISLRRWENERMVGPPVVRFEQQRLRGPDQEVFQAIWNFVSRHAREPRGREIPQSPPPPRTV
jgi:hypothetical protein